MITTVSEISALSASPNVHIADTRIASQRIVREAAAVGVMLAQSCGRLSQCDVGAVDIKHL